MKRGRMPSVFTGNKGVTANWPCQAEQNFSRQRERPSSVGAARRRVVAISWPPIVILGAFLPGKPGLSGGTHLHVPGTQCDPSYSRAARVCMLEKESHGEVCMKRLLLLLSCAFCLSAAAPSASASTDIRFWHRNHKDPSKTTVAPKPKAKRTFLHRAKPSREQAARSEATFGMTGPKSVGWRHPEPGPAGVGSK
jgi:hypothetical protein